jgi:TP901 family phage tail tape measure protein
VEIIFGALDNTGSGLASVSGNLNSITDQASNITGPLSQVAEYAVKAELAVMALATAYGTYAVVKAAEFETAQIDLNKVLNEGDPAISTFTASVMELSEKYGVSSANVLQGIANFKEAGFTAKESAELQKTALDLVIAGDVDAARASEILVSALKGFNAEASQAPRFIEALNNVSNDYATDVNQLAEGMSRVAPILKIMGFSFEEGTGLLTPMIEVFRDGSIAADALKTGLVKLVDDSAPVTSALKALGVSQTDLNGHMRSGKDIFYDVANAFTTLDQNQKLVFASQLFGIEQAPKLITVFDNIAKVNEVTASAMAVTGSVAKEVDLRLESMAKQGDILKTSFDNLAIAIGTRINAQLGGLAAGSSDVFQAFRKIVDSGGLDQFFEALRPQIESFSKTLQNIAVNLPAAFTEVDFGGLIAALKELGFEFGGIFEGLDLNTVDGLASAIQFMVDSFESLTRVVAGVVEAWAPLAGALIDGIQSFNEMDDSAKKTFGNVSGLADIFETFKSTLTGGLDAIKTIGVALSVMAGSNVVSGIMALGPAFAGVGIAALPLVTTITAIAIGVGGLTFGITENIKAWDEYKSSQDASADATAQLIETQARNKTRLEEISASTGIAVGSTKELNAAIDEGRIIFNDATGAYQAAGTGVKDYDAEVSAASTGGFNFADAVNNVALSLGLVDGSAKEATSAVNDLGKSTQDAADLQRGYRIEIIDGIATYTQYGDALSAADNSTKSLKNSTLDANKAAVEGSKEWKTAQDVMLATQKQTDDFTISMGNLANKRYEIDVKANVDLKTADIVAQTARITAAFQSTTEVIATLTSGTTDLWALFSGKAGFTGAEEIKAAAERMDMRLDEELAIKREMTDAIVQKMRAESFRLESGEPLISIDARELAPELELVFDKILKYTQIKATQQGLSLLVGLA